MCRTLLMLATLPVLAIATFADGADAGPRTAIPPGTIVFDFPPGGNSCYPQDWTFFGYPQTDFGFDADAEDGGGAFQAVDWTECDVFGYPQCQWTGSAIGVGVFNHPQCTPGGVSDANLDFSLGTGLTIRIKNNLAAGVGGTAGARLQVQLVDNDGTAAVTPRVILQNPSVNRMPKLADTWQTYTFYFDGLDWAYDNDDAVAGNPPGLNLSHIKEIKLLWRRSGASDINVFEFDKITLINTPPQPWADRDADRDVDIRDLAGFQACFGAAVAQPCARMDANGDGAINASDWSVWKDCMLGPDTTTGFYAWAY